MNKKIISAVLIIICIVSIFFPVYASSVNLDLQISKQDVYAGDEIEVTLKLKNYQEIDEGLNAYKAQIQYDKKVFQPLTENSFTSKNKWEGLQYNPESNEFVAIKKAGSKSEEEIVTIKLKVKEDAKGANTVVAIKNFVTSEGKNDIEVQSVLQKEIHIIEKSSKLPDNNSGSLNDKPNEPEQLPQKLPYTGVWLNNSLIIIAIIVLLVIAYTSRKKGKKIDNKIQNINKILSIFLVTGIIFIRGYGIVKALGDKGELNADNVIDYKDVNLLKSHLISLNTISTDFLENADMNNDRYITVTDLSLLVKKVEKSIVYEANINGIQVSNYYPNKGEEITLKIDASVNNGAKIEKVRIGDTEYSTVNEENIYVVTLKAPERCGINELKISQITLDVGRIINVDYTERIDVLKQIPSIKNYTLDENIELSSLSVKFEVVDEDSSIKTGTVSIVDEDNTKVKEQEILIGKNEITFDAVVQKNYMVDISIGYDLDTNLLTEQEQDHSGTLIKRESAKLLESYNIQLSDFATYDENSEQKDSFEKQEKIKVRFNVKNDTGVDIASVVIDENQNLEATKIQDNQYEITVNGFDEAGTKKLAITEIILSNGKHINLSSDNTFTIYIKQDIPTVQSDQIVEEDNKLFVEILLKDDDSRLKNANLVVVDENNNVLLKKDVLAGNHVYEIDTTQIIAKQYNVKVIATYENSNGVIEENKTIYEKTVIAKAKVIIEQATVSDKYVEKSSTFTIKYNIKTNKEESITKVQINNQEVGIKSLGNNVYEVELQAPDTFGKLELKTTKLYCGEEIVNVQFTNEIEVLKTPISLEDYRLEENLRNQTVIVHFTLIDNDDTFISGKLQLVKDENEEVKKEIDITEIGDNSIEIDVEENFEYTLKIIAKYGRDIEKQQKVEEKILLEKPVQFIKDYGLEIDNIKTKNIETNTESKYYKKGEKLKLSFTSTNKTKFYPEFVFIDGEKYKLGKQLNDYTLEFIVPNVSGKKTLTIDKMLMNNGLELIVDSNNSIEIEVLKDEPKIENFIYEKTENDTLQIIFDLVDEEETVKSAKIEIKDVTGKIVKQQDITKGQNKLEFTLNTSEKYTVKIISTYDLDTDETDINKYTDKEIFEYELTASVDVIELKDISDVEIYHKTNGTIEKIDFLNLENGIPQDLENYYVKVKMEELPTFYSNIREIKKDDNGKVYVTINQNEFIRYQKQEDKFNKQYNFTFEVPYRDNQGEHTLVKKANEFFENISKNLSGNYDLTEDLDASDIETLTSAVTGTFTGTLNGNGHKIINLSTGMFEKLNNATIKNLVIENANVTTSVKAIVAGVIENGTTIENVHIKLSTISNNEASMGAIVGNAINSTVKSCSATEVFVKGNNTIGGIVGNTSSGTTIENCYVTGKLQGTLQHNLGSRVGGITGWHSGTTINHCYTNVNIVSPSAKGNGGIIGGPNEGGTPRIENCFAMTSGIAYKIAGFDVLTNVDNIYEYEGGNAITNINANNSEKVKLLTDLYIKEFYKGELKLDEDVWNLDFIQYQKLPNLKSDTMPSQIEDYEIIENKNKIPNYEEVRKNQNYQQTKEILYYNVSKLIPFADTNRWVEYANTISTEGLMSTQKIKFILPLDKDNKLVLGIQKDDVNKVTKIKVIYEDNKSEDFEVKYSKTIEKLVAVYQVPKLNIQYQFGNYIANIDETLKQKIVNEAKEYDYAQVIANTTEEDESRLYVDYYNESVKSKIEEIIGNYLLTQEDYPTYCNNQIIQSQIAEKFTKDKIIKLLYAYNYFDKWYNIDLDGVIISKLMFFNGYYIDKNITTDYLIDSIYKVDKSLRATGATNKFYENTLQVYTGKNMPDFLAYLMQTINGYDNPSDWFVEHFKGILKEQKAYGGTEEIKYRIWDIFETLGDRTNIILPILTAPQEDMYIISMPSQFVIGSMNRYKTYLTKDGKERERMQEIIAEYSEKIGHFYGTVANLMQNSAQQLNSFVHIQFDTRFNFPEGSKVTSGTQEAGTTNDPVLKWVNEAVGQWGAANGAGAYANGTNVFWIVYAALDGDYSFTVFAHETAHNQDGRYFYGGSGRRNGTGPEAHADGNIAQDMGDGSMVFNLSRKFDITQDITNNFTYERINTPEKIKDYYKDMFETGYVLDYLVGQAFLKLTPEQQANVAVQASYEEDGKALITTYSTLTAEDFRQMNLKDMESLWNNKIALKSPGTRGSASYGTYGYESFYDVNWYQAHNDNGAPDSNSFKRLGQEMLGIGGYENGYATYMSGRSQTDLDALRKITGDNSITWKQYKLNRYEEVRLNLSKIPYFDSEQVIKQFEEALKIDAVSGNRDATTNVKRLIFGLVKRATNDFLDGDIYTNPTETSITSAEQLIKLANSNILGNYRLDADIDFSTITVNEGNYYIDQFVGILDGNNHKITGLKYPLFNNMIYAQVKNLVIEKPKYNTQAEAFLSINSKNSSISNIHIQESNLELPIIKNKTNAYYEYGENIYTVEQVEINTLEDFIKIGTEEGGTKKKYVINNDIDFTEYSGANSVINESFVGSIDGKGHTLSNLKNASLFNEFRGTVKNLNIKDFNNTGGDMTTAFTKTSNNAVFENMKFENITLKGTHRTSVVSGTDNANSTFDKITVKNANVTGSGVYVSTFIGRKYGGKITNCYVQGTLECYTTECAGIVGATHQTVIIENVISNVNVNRPKSTDDRNNNGGFVGNIYNTPSIRNCISIGNMTGFDNINVNKFAGCIEETIIKCLENCYEFADSTGVSSITSNTGNSLKTATSQNLREKTFYVNTLHFDENIWDFANLATNGYPELKK